MPMQEMQVHSVGWRDPLKEGIATHASILAWRILWTEELGRLQSRSSQRWTQLSTHTSQQLAQEVGAIVTLVLQMWKQAQGNFPTHTIRNQQTLDANLGKWLANPSS